MAPLPFSLFASCSLWWTVPHPPTTMLFCLLAQKQWIKELGTGNMKTMTQNKYLFFKLAYIWSFVIDMKNLSNVLARHGGSWLLLRKMLRSRLAWTMLCSRHYLKTLKYRKGEREKDNPSTIKQQQQKNTTHCLEATRGWLGEINLLSQVYN